MWLVAILIMAGCWYLLNLYEKGTNYSPSPNEESIRYDDDGFPSIDWDYWKSINSDVVGWITIPNTSVDFPIVQAHADDPTFYLLHDVYTNVNYTGAIYLDPDCEEQGGIDNSKNVVIFGHNMGLGDDTMFEPISHYMKLDFAQEHERILIQTPNKKMAVGAFGVENINGNKRIKQTEFSTEEVFQEYINVRYSQCDIQIKDCPLSPAQIFTLCTCSYNFNPTNERTLVYASKILTL